MMIRPRSQRDGRLYLLILSSCWLAASCGVTDFYSKRKARCKKNCEKQEQVDDSDGTARTSLGLPLTASDWVKATPLVALDDSEVVKLLIANPFVTVSASDPSYSTSTSSLQTLLGDIEENSRIAASITEEARSANKAKDCYYNQFAKAPRQENETLIYELNPALCFSLEQVQQSLRLGEAAQARSVTAIAYEDAYRIVFPLNQIQFSLTGSALSQHLKDLGQSVGATILPLQLATGTSRRVVDIAHLTANGLSSKDPRGKTYYELTWDYVALTGLAGETGFRLLEGSTGTTTDTDTDTDTVWNFRGNMVQSSGATRDPTALRLSSAAEGMGFVRIVTFETFQVTLPATPKAAPSSGLAAPAQAFVSGTNAKLSGIFRIAIHQPNGILRFSATGRDEPCLVEIFAGEDVANPEASLGTLNLCRSAAK